MKYLSIVLFLCFTVFVQAQDYTPEFEADDCPYFVTSMATTYDANITCGYLIVPENRENIKGSLELELFVIQIESIQTTDNAPFVYLEGGPGGAASVSLGAWLESDILQAYDIILIDQRGTGLSYPSLNCPEVNEDSENPVEDCRNRLVDEGIDLNAYTSASNANDIHDLLVALDIPEANIYGSSYGVRLGLTMMRDFPQRMRSLIIDAVYPPQVDALVDQAFYGNQAFEQLFNDCANDPDCNVAYPNLRDSFYTAIENMNNEPAEIEDFELGEIVETTGDDFANQLFLMLYDTTLLPYLPAMIDAYANGEYDYDPLGEVAQIELDEAYESGTIEPDEIDKVAFEYLEIDDVDELYDYYASLTDEEFDNLINELEEYAYLVPFRDYLEFDDVTETSEYVYDLDEDELAELEVEVLGEYDGDSEGMNYSVECGEENYFNDIDDIVARGDDLPEILIGLTDSVVFAYEDCDIWNVEQAGDIENQPVVSDIPTLIFSGLYDPVTPFQWGDDTQSYLPNSAHFIFPNVGHGALDVELCATEIALSFLENPMQDLDGSCISQLTPPDFYIRF